MRNSTRIVIVGGGLAGLEAALYLRERMEERAHITIVSENEHFLFRPFLTYVPFGLDPQSVKLDLSSISSAHDIQFHTGRVDAVNSTAKLVQAGSQSFRYDYLILATGASIVREPIEGIGRGFTIWNEAEMGRLRTALEKAIAAAQAGKSTQILFLVPPGCAWSGPLYEIALMTSTWLRRKELRGKFELRLVTHEKSFIEVLGSRIEQAIGKELSTHDITAEVERTPARVEQDRVVFEDGPDAPFDLLITAPVYRGTGPRDGVAVDAQGFYWTVLETRQSVTADDIYAVGDASDYPVKQGYLALLQADSAGEHIASRVLGVEPEFQFRPSTFWMMEELNATLFAYGLEADQLDEVESLPAGRLRRLEMMGYLPKHSRLGNPLYSGLLWKGTEVGLRVLDGLSVSPREADKQSH